MFNAKAKKTRNRISNFNYKSNEASNCTYNKSMISYKRRNRQLLNWEGLLESRELLALTLGNLDSLNAFGANAANARVVLQQAVTYWNSYLDINTPFPIDVFVDMNPDLGPGASATSTATMSFGGRTRPCAGEITVNFAGGNRYFFDPTPHTNEEFTEISAPFVASATNGDALLHDFLTLTMHELGHALGFNQRWLSPTGPFFNNSFTTDIGRVYPDTFRGDGSSATYWAYNSPTVQTLLTNFNSGLNSTASDFIGPTHAAQNGSQTNFTFGGINYFTTRDLMNPFYDEATRVLISYNDVNILAESVGWGLGLTPVANFLINMDADGNLTVNGDASDNLITVETTEIGQVEIIVTTRIFGVLPNNMATASFPVGFLQRLTADAEGGNDHVDLSQFQSPLSLLTVVDGGWGDDLIHGSPMNDSIFGSDGNDTIYGNNGDDTINGSWGNDFMIVGIGDSTILDLTGSNLYDWRLNLNPINFTAGWGDDTIYGTNFSDSLSGGEGNDEIYGYEGSDTIIGGQDADQLFGGDGADLFLWNAGDNSDLIDGGTGSDASVFTGTDGTDCFHVASDDLLTNLVRVDVNASGGPLFDGSILAADVEHVSLQGGLGDDLYEIAPLALTPVKLLDIDYGATGNDVAKLNLPIEGAGITVTPTLSAASAQINGLKEMIRFFNATSADTLLVEGSLSDDIVIVYPEVLATMSVVVDGNNGDDYINGATTAMGGAGDDTLIGTAFGDLLLGGLGNDSIDGLAGDDLILGDADGTGAGSVDITCDGGLTPSMPAFAISAYSPEGGNDTIRGGEGNDSLNGGGADDEIYGEVGEDLIGLLALGSNPWLPTAFDEPGDDRIWGGIGADTIDGSAGNDEIYGDAGADLIRGGQYADMIWGGDDIDVIYGNQGNDTVHGDAGDDTIFGNEDNDEVYGDTGADLIYGNDGDDLIAGGADSDTVYGGLGGDVIHGDEGGDILSGGPAASEGANPMLDGNDIMFGGAGLDVVNGDYGNDSVNGGEGNDQLWGSEGDDVIGVFDFMGETYLEPGDDSMVGGNGNDAIRGAITDSSGNLVNDGNDIIFGEGGNDTLWGGAGGDMIYGGLGDDFMLGGTPLTANTLHKPRKVNLPNDGNDTMLGGDGFDQVDGGNDNNLLEISSNGLSIS